MGLKSSYFVVRNLSENGTKSPVNVFGTKYWYEKAISTWARTTKQRQYIDPISELF